MVEPGRQGDVYSEAKDEFVMEHGQAAWLRSKLRADLIEAMSDGERKRRRFTKVAR